jgi:hypothetical protein
VTLAGTRGTPENFDVEKRKPVMTLKLYAFTCGTVTGEFGHLMEGGEGDITVPVPVFLIEHAKGRALFDTGLLRIASATPLGASARGLPDCSGSAFSPARK